MSGWGALYAQVSFQEILVFHCFSLFFMVVHSFAWFFIVFSWFFIVFSWFFQRTGFQRTGNPSVFIVGHPSMDIH
jgi:hypothetical protein